MEFKIGDKVRVKEEAFKGGSLGGYKPVENVAYIVDIDEKDITIRFTKGYKVNIFGRTIEANLSKYVCASELELIC